MSFRVKSTHELLKPQQPPPKTFLDSSSENKDDEYLSNLFSNTSTEKQKQRQNRPRDGSNKGMAIRTVSSAQADHM